MRSLLILLKASFLVAAISFTIWSSATTLATLSRIEAIESDTLDVPAHAQSLIESEKVGSAKEWTATARALIEKDQSSDDLAIRLLERALLRDRYDYHAWALLSYARTRAAGEFNSSAADALRNSIQYCRLCDDALLRWRLVFVIENWPETSEPIRVSVFEGADLLRWWHLDGDFLGNARRTALQQGIPFDEYRANVDTPVRANEIGR